MHLIHSSLNFCREHFEELTASLSAAILTASLELSTFIGYPAAILLSSTSVAVEQGIKSGFVIFNALIVLVLSFFGKRWLEKRFKKED